MNITFIGGGNMAGAIIGGLLKKPTEFSADHIRVVEINPDARQAMKRKFHIGCYEKISQAVRDDDVIIFAVKPQSMHDAAGELHKSLPAGHAFSGLVISIAAGIRLVDLSRWLGGHTRLIRAMPNTPALIGEGITALYPMLAGMQQGDMERAETILSAIGSTVRVNQEDEMNAITAISGSGPAYVFAFMEALEQAAVDLNLPKEAARKLVLQTFIGAARLAADQDESLSTLRERVTSKGGTTEAALKVMNQHDIKKIIIDAAHAANERGRELGELLGKD